MSSSAGLSARPLQRLVAWISDLRLAIVLLLVIALASGVGTAIPQKELSAFYHERYDGAPWLGLLRGEGVLALQLDHVYSSGWFLALLAWLGLSLLLCSWRRQWPALQASLRWIDYRSARQLSKLSVAETRQVADAGAALESLAERLRRGGWQVQPQTGRLAARRGLAGRFGPLLVHAGLVVLMVGAAWGSLAGQRLEQFLAPGRELELLDEPLPFRERFHVILCRRMPDAADDPARARVRRRIVEQLSPGGYLILGGGDAGPEHDLGLQGVAPAVYRRPF